MFKFFNKKQDNKDNFTTVEDTKEQQDTLFEAVKNQNIYLIKKLIQEGANINEQNEQGNSALRIAVTHRTTKNDLHKQHFIIGYLLENGADAYQKNNYNYNVLEIMRGKSHYDDIVKIFHKHGYVVNKESKENLVVISKKVEEENLIKNTNERNISIDKIKQLTELLKKTEITRGSYKNGRKTIDYAFYVFSHTIDVIGVNLHLDANSDSSIYMQLKIGDKSYTISKYNLDNDKYGFYYSIDDVSVNPFEKSIRIIFIRMIDKTIELLQDKTKKIQDAKNAKDIEQKNLIDKLVQDIQYTPSSKKTEDANLPKDMIETQSQTIKNLEDNLQLQSREAKGLKDEEQAIKNSDLNEITFKLESFANKLNEQINFVKNYIAENEKNTNQHASLKIKQLEEKFESRYEAQNKFIKSINSEIEHLKTEVKNSIDNKQIEELKLQAKVFQSTLTYQSDKIIELQNQLIMKEQKTKTLVDSFMSKINKLEEKIAKQKVVKTQIPLNIPTEKQSIKKDDGVIVKRESFDDF